MRIATFFGRTAIYGPAAISIGNETHMTRNIIFDIATCNQKLFVADRQGAVWAPIRLIIYSVLGTTHQVPRTRHGMALSMVILCGIAQKS